MQISKKIWICKLNHNLKKQKEDACDHKNTSKTAPYYCLNCGESYFSSRGIFTKNKIMEKNEKERVIFYQNDKGLIEHLKC